MSRVLHVFMLAALLWTSPIAFARAQAFPPHRVTFIVPFSAGGATDIIARALADELSRLWDRPVVVENVAAAGGLVGTARVAKASPDGQTLLITAQESLVHNRFLYRTLPYDPDKSLVPITMIARGAQLVIVPASFPATNLLELVDVARRRPGEVAFGSSGVGSQPYLLFEAMAKQYGVTFVHIPYRGQALVAAAVMAGEVQLSTGSLAVAGPLIEQGKIKALAIGGAERSKRFPNVPTVSESGLNLDFTSWWGLLAPGGMRPELVDRINRDVVSVARQPAFVEKYFTKLGMEPVLDTPSEFAEAIRKDVVNVGEMVKAVDLKPID